MMRPHGRGMQRAGWGNAARLVQRAAANPPAAHQTRLGEAGLRQLFAIADFRRLWLAGAIGSAVRWLDTLAFSVVAYQQSGSAFVVAMLSMLRLLPMGLLGALIGAYAERVQRRGIQSPWARWCRARR